ncbi:hypothetical protein LLH23_05680 [bacterium]|nr:hypothetical protein [bacterium]
MGKRFSAAAAPSPGKKPRAGLPLYAWIALIVIGLLIVAIAVLVYFNYVRPQPELPAAPQVQLPDLPKGPALPEKKVEDAPSAALPQTQVTPQPQAPLAQAPPQPQKPQPSGTVTWAWQLYPVTPSILGVQIQNQMPGYQFVAMGIQIWNDCTENVPVDNNAFTLNVDNRIYRSDQFSTADAVINGLPFLTATTLAPGGRVQGQTAYMIPRVYSRISADWQLQMPATVKVRRVDPKSAVVPAGQYTPPTPQPKGEAPWDDEK